MSDQAFFPLTPTCLLDFITQKQAIYLQIKKAMVSNRDAAQIPTPRVTVGEAQDFLARAEKVFQTKPFNPHRVFSGGHAQTLASYAWPRRLRLRAEVDEERFFQVADDTKVLAHCRWQSRSIDHPTIVIWHGMEGSSSAVYMLATAQKAYRAGFNVVRMNVRARVKIN